MSKTAQNQSATQILSTDDQALWHAALPASRSVFGSSQFVSILERHTGYRGHLFLFTNGGETIVYPFLLRSFTDLPFAARARVKSWDSVSPDYTGPLALGPVSASTASNFLAQFHAYCQQEQIIAEFAHLHPHRCSPTALAVDDVGLDREIVYVDLSLSHDQLWRHSFTHACRKNIKRAQKENIRVFAAETLGDITAFHRVYCQTMERHQALAKYHFPLDYFVDFFEQMPGNARFVLAAYNDQIIAGTLYLYDDDEVYSFLGGADHAYQHVRPTNAVVYDTISWAQQQGKKRLILGGGYRPNDTIFRFKTSFSPLRDKFYLYKHVHLAEPYAALCGAWSDYYAGRTMATDYFPSYRSTPTT